MNSSHTGHKMQERLDSVITTRLYEVPYKIRDVRCLFRSCNTINQKTTENFIDMASKLSDLATLWAAGDVNLALFMLLSSELFFYGMIIETYNIIYSEWRLFTYDCWRNNHVYALLAFPYVLESKRNLRRYVLQTVIWYFTEVPFAAPCAFTLALVLAGYIAYLSYTKKGLAWFIIRRWLFVGLRSYGYVLVTHCLINYFIPGWKWMWSRVAFFYSFPFFLETWGCYYLFFILGLFFCYLNIRVLKLIYGEDTKGEQKPILMPEIAVNLYLEFTVVLLAITIATFMIFHWGCLAIATEWGVVLALGITAALATLIYRLY